MTVNTDAPFGFAVHGPLLRERLYAVNTEPVIHIYHNDIVIAGGAIVSTPAKGYLMDIADAAVPDGTAGILGAVTAIFDENMMPVSYIAATEEGNGVIAGYVMVADHPDQEFIAQEDGTTNAIDLADGSQNVDVVSVTICAGDTNTGISTQELASDTISANVLQIKLIRPHERDLPADDTDIGCRWICQINEHFYGDTIVGA